MNKTRKIALEEHFMAPGFEEYSSVFLNSIGRSGQSELARRLADFDELRLQAMDEAGIELMVLSQTGPGVQAEADGELAIAQARRNNDYLAERIERNPARYAGFAMLPMHDPGAAARELERAVRELGFLGALVNGHSNGVYYDAPQYDEFWAALQELDVPFYLHPANSYQEPYCIQGRPELAGAIWGWGVETGTHALRLLFAGVFDRFPGVKLILGHMGEGLPFLRWRFDSRFLAYPHGIELRRAPSEYFGLNIVITTSGVCSHHALIGAIGEMGADAVMFSVDYPYESIDLAARFIEAAPIDPFTRNLICHGNAERLLRLPSRAAVAASSLPTA